MGGATDRVHVVIDGLDGDRVDEGKAPFISSLLAERDTYYRESRSAMIAETNPNHVATMTGACGNASGLPGNAFALYARSPARLLPGHRTGRRGQAPSVTSGESSGCVLAKTVFGAMRRQGIRTASLPPPSSASPSWGASSRAAT